jgi:hypothetical protein
MRPTYTSLFIELGKYAAITAIVVTGMVATATLASSQGLKAPGNSPFKAISAQLAIKSPSVNVCPANAKMAGWIMTNKPGTVSYMIARKGGSVSGPFTLEAVKSVNGGMASFSKVFPVHQAIDAEYRILVSGTDGQVMSNWVPLKASCKIQLGG